MAINIEKKTSISCFCLFFIILLWGPSYSDAGFLVELKNGRTISAEAYRVSGGTIELYFDSGVFRFSTNEVRSIKEVTRGEVNKDKEAEKTSSNDPAAQKAPSDADIKKRIELQEKLEEAKKAYFDAEKADKERQREAMVSVSRELHLLEEEVRQKNNGALPEWWNQN